MLPRILLRLSISSLALANPLQLDTSQSLTNATLDADLLTDSTFSNITSLSAAEIGCFKPTPGLRSLFPSNKVDCEIAIDNWVRGQDLTTPRTFSQKLAIGRNDVHLPVQAVYRTCFFYLQTMNYDDESFFSLAELYAEVLGPDGIAKNCLGQKHSPAWGGRMALGPSGLVKGMVTGRRFPSNDADGEP